MNTNCISTNTFDTFWQVLVEPPITQEEWDEAAQKALAVLSMEQDVAVEDILPRVLGEATYGPKRWQLSAAKRLYYQVKPLLPRALRTFGRQHYRQSQEAQFPPEMAC